MTTRNREQTLAFRYLPFANAFCFCFWRFALLLSVPFVSCGFLESKLLWTIFGNLWDHLGFQGHLRQLEGNIGTSEPGSCIMISRSTDDHIL
jgi:hypothetical protein